MRKKYILFTNAKITALSLNGFTVKHDSKLNVVIS